MNASLLVPCALIASIIVGLSIFVIACVAPRHRSRLQRVAWGLAGATIAGVINSWWIGFALLAFYKLYILREDT